MDNIYKRLLNLRNEELDWYLEEGQDKEKYTYDERMKHLLTMQNKRKEYHELCTLLEKDMFNPKTMFRDIDKVVSNLESGIIGVKEIISENFLDVKKSFQVEFDDNSFVEILEDEIVSFGLTKEDKFKIAIVIAINHLNED